MKLNVNIREILEAQASTYDGTIQINATVELEELLDNLPDEEEIDVDIHELLETNRQIAAIWSIEDVQSVRPDLDEDQAWDVLKNVDHHKDAELGITWLTLKMAAEHMFGEAPETDDQEEVQP